MFVLNLITAIAAIAACTLAFLAWRAAGRAGAAGVAGADPQLVSALVRLEQSLARVPADLREDARGHREEDRLAQATHVEKIDARLGAVQRGLEDRLGGFEKAQAEHMSGLRGDSLQARGQLDQALKDGFERLTQAQAAALAQVGEKLQVLTADNEKRQDAIRLSLTENLERLRKDNEAKLEQMRATVDEKLQGTLDKRLGESFQLVSDRLDKVHAGLGEMQSLANGVGDLKRVLTNVKARGGWGELRLGQLLEDMLTPDQYESQVSVRDGAGERVDFAVKLPGRSEDGAPLWLPIDCKFPQEDYERLQAAQERGDSADVESCAQALERAVRIQAKSIAQKYVHPPQTTNFAILYLPTEGLYAEVIRRPGLMADLQTHGGVMVTGPTTLAAMLNSLQMGFKSLAVEKRSADVWKVLGEAKAEFRKYGEVWGKLGEKLDQAKGLHESVAVRSRAVERKLRSVETLEVESAPLLALVAAEEDEAA